jgi:hypothetical protein
MHARDREVIPTGPGAAWRTLGAPIGATILVAALAWGCGTQVTPSPPPSAIPSAPAATVTLAPTPSPSPPTADTLRVGWGPQWQQINGFRFATE